MQPQIIYLTFVVALALPEENILSMVVHEFVLLWPKSFHDPIGVQMPRGENVGRQM
jgi:hypothetical protein